MVDVSKPLSLETSAETPEGCLARQEASNLVDMAQVLVNFAPGASSEARAVHAPNPALCTARPYVITTLLDDNRKEFCGLHGNDLATATSRTRPAMHTELRNMAPWRLRSRVDSTIERQLVQNDSGSDPVSDPTRFKVRSPILTNIIPHSGIPGHQMKDTCQSPRLGSPMFYASRNPHVRIWGREHKNVSCIVQVY
jgi:hypothetical protein